MIDTHCHLDSDAFLLDRDEVIRRAWDAGVDAYVVPGIAPGQWTRELDVCKAIPGAVPVLGLHPWRASAAGPGELDAAMLTLGRLSERAEGIGEIGLDRRMGQSVERRERQEEAFRRQLQLANELEYPVILHCVEAHGRMLDLLCANPPVAGGIVHSYSGSVEMMADYARLGLHFGFGLSALRPRALRAAAAVRAAPAERLLVETDAPNQSAEPHDVNEPAALARVARGIAELRGEPVEKVVERSDAAVRRLFSPGCNWEAGDG